MKSGRKFLVFLCLGLPTLTEPAQAEEAIEGTSSTFRFVTESGYPQSYSSMVFSPDGSRLAISIGEKTHIINTELGEITGQVKSSAHAMNFARNGDKLLMISTYDRKLVDMIVSSEKSIPHKANPGYLGLSLEQRNGKLLVSGFSPGSPVAKSGELKVGDELVGIGEGRGGNFQESIGWTVKTAVERLAGPAGSFVRLKIMPRGKLQAVTHTFRRMPGTLANGKVTFAELPKPDLKDNLVICMRDGRHSFDNASSGQTVVELSLQDIDYFMKAYAPQAQRFAAIGRGRSEKNQAMEVYDLATQERMAFIPHVTDNFYALEFAADGKELFVGTWDTIEVYNVETQSHDRTLPLTDNPSLVAETDDDDGDESGGSGIAASVINAARDTIASGAKSDRKRSDWLLLKCMALSPRGIVATADPSGNVKLWDSRTGEKLKDLLTAPELKDKDRIEVKDLVYSPNGTHVAYLIEGILHVTNVAHVTAQPAEVGEVAAKPKTLKQRKWQVAEGVEVEIMSRGMWYPGKVMKKRGDLWEIHYAESPDDWNEFVPASKLREPAADEDGAIP